VLQIVCFTDAMSHSPMNRYSLKFRSMVKFSI